MNFNYGAIKSLTDRITPTLKHGVEGFKHPDRIYFKPSDIPTEEVSSEAQQVVTTVAEDATVAPFADRLVHPDLFGLSPAVNTEKAVVNSARHIIKQVKDEKIKNVFENLYPRILDYSSDIPKDSERMTSLMKSLDILDNPKIKDQILFSLDYLSKDTPKKFDKYYDSVMTYAEDYADAANSLRGKYLNIDNGAHNFYKEMDKKNVWIADVLDGTKKTEDKYRNKYLTNPKKIKPYENYVKGFDEYTKKGYKETYQNNLKQDAMKDFLYNHIDSRPDAVKTLYNEEYLKTLPPEISKECAEIQKEYGTYVIDSNHNATLDDIKYIKEELRLWKEAGKEQAIFPKAIYVNNLDEYLNKNNCAGCAVRPINNIYLQGLLEYDGNAEAAGTTLRHEIQHLHDFKMIIPKNSFQEARDFISWNYRKLRHGKEWDKELENAGIFDEYLRKYALTQECEKRSVTAESDMSKLSKKYKDDLIKHAYMQSWIFDLKRNKYIPPKINEQINKQVSSSIDDAPKADVGLFS